jgi:hypothetical protein
MRQVECGRIENKQGSCAVTRSVAALKDLSVSSIFIAVMNIVPNSSMSVARSGHRQPRTMPITIATRTWPCNCRHHGFAAIHAACSSVAQGLCHCSLPDRDTPSTIGTRQLGPQ